MFVPSNISLDTQFLHTGVHFHLSPFFISSFVFFSNFSLFILFLECNMLSRDFICSILAFRIFLLPLVIFVGSSFCDFVTYSVFFPSFLQFRVLRILFYGKCCHILKYVFFITDNIINLIFYASVGALRCPLMFYQFLEECVHNIQFVSCCKLHYYFASFVSFSQT